MNVYKTGKIMDKRKLKRNIYKHGNAIIYLCIFAVASIITLVAVLSRTDRVMIVDDSQIAISEKNSVELKNKDTQKVASKDKAVEITTVGIQKTTGTKVKVVVDTLNVRSEATQDSDALGMAEQDEVFRIISEDGEWIEIDYNGNNGFVKAQYVEVE